MVVSVNPVRAIRHRRRSVANRRFVSQSYRQLLGHEPDQAALRSSLDRLEDGAARTDVLLFLVRSDEYVERITDEVGGQPDAPDDVFLAAAYRHVLRRDPDQDGMRFYGAQLRAGVERGEVVRALVSSDEHVNRVLAPLYQLPSLRERWPDRYRQVETTSGERRLVFDAASPRWFDRLESAILASDYYEKPGIWEFSMNRDKRLMAEIVSALEPAAVLEIGCSNGTVLQCLHQSGVEVTGLDISPSAIARADPSIRERIRLGDLLTVELPQTYDVVFGLDVFEHLNPNRLQGYLRKVRSLTRPGGFVFTNLPAFGDDPVFGTVFPMDLEDWGRDAAAGRPFSLLPVDDEGYPFHGHLVWASSAWWVAQFEGVGLRREPTVEQALHDCYDPYMAANSPARRSFYVFSRDRDAADVAALAERIRRRGSTILDQEWRPTVE